MPINISNNRVDLTDIARITEEDANRLSRHIVKKGDIIYSRRGDVTRKALITASEEGMFCGTGCLLVRPGNIIDPRFLTYHLSTPENQEWIIRHAIGATMPNLNTGILAGVPLRVPTLETQKSIAHILGTLDDKIELNRRMNATLEAMAQALFKSWFVDFDPVIDNALAAGNPIPEPLRKRAEVRAALGDKRKPLPEAIQKRFPSRFVFSEAMGWIPEGWNFGVLSEIAELKTQSIHPNKEPATEWNHFSIPAFDEGMWPTLDLGETIKSGKYMVPSSCVLASKLNPQFPRVWMPDVETEEISICSTEFMPFVPLRHSERTYLYSLLCSEVIQTEITNRVTGSTGSRQRVKPKEIAELPIIIVPQKVRKSFSEAADPYFSKKARNKRAEIALTKLRDTLLPKLLSGQLRIPDAEKRVADAV
jgi:type I restriction enzyme S subunit